MSAPPGSHPQRGAWAAFAACSAIWGSTFLAISVGNDSLPPLWAASLRLMIAIPVLVAITLARGHRLPRGAGLRAALAFGFLNMGMGFSLLYLGEVSVPSGLTAVVYATIPLSTALFARLYGLERPGWLKLAGATVAFGGVAAIGAGQMRGQVPLAALAAVTVAAVCASLSGVMLKRGPRQDPFGANAVGSLAGLGVCLAASFLAREPHPLPTAATQLAPLLYLALAGSVGAFVLYAWLVNHWPVSRISFISVVVPVVALGLGWAFRGERLGAADGVGCALVLAGLAMAIASDRRRAPTTGPA